MPSVHVFHHTFHAMGTRFSLVLPDVDWTTGETLANVAEAEIRQQERLMSRYDVHSPVSEINRVASLQPVTAPQALWNVITLCREHWERSHGAFDIAKTSPESGFEHVKLDIPAHAVSFTAPGIQLDLGGIGKGIALESVVQEFKARGVPRVFFSFGESSIVVIGSHPGGAPWPVGITDLFDPGTALHTFHLRDASVATSGNAPSTVGALGHIFDSHGRLATGYRTVSVASPSAVDAEVLSTALFAVPEAERAGILAGYPGVAAVEIVYGQDENTWAGKIVWRHES